MTTVRGGLATAEWRAVLQALPADRRDVYFQPDYLGLHEANGDGQPYAAVVQEGRTRLLVTGLRVPIAGTDRWDLQTPNGYGGPLCSDEADASFLERGWAAFLETAAADGLVACFFRLHPLLANERWLPEGARVLDNRSTVYVELGKGREVAWRAASSRHRNMVRKAQAAGSTVAWNQPSDWPDFEALYRASMGRLDAPGSLRFTPAYFDALRLFPGAELGAVRTATGLAAAAVFLLGSSFAHYHLMARRVDTGNSLGNLVLEAAAERAESAGKSGLHLGGGRTGDARDSLLAFKKGLGGRLLTFRVASVVADPATYETLVGEWRRRAEREPHWLLGYREPLASA